MKLRPALASRIEGAWGLAMSVEPKGGSPTGKPTGPVIFRGQCVKIL
jgi:anti-sigma-K factor RskA